MAFSERPGYRGFDEACEIYFQKRFTKSAHAYASSSDENPRCGFITACFRGRFASARSDSRTSSPIHDERHRRSILPRVFTSKAFGSVIVSLFFSRVSFFCFSFSGELATRAATDPSYDK